MDSGGLLVTIVDPHNRNGPDSLTELNKNAYIDLRRAKLNVAASAVFFGKFRKYLVHAICLSQGSGLHC